MNRQMVLDGMAWRFTRYSDDATLTEAEREAHATGRGLWRDQGCRCRRGNGGLVSASGSAVARGSLT